MKLIILIFYILILAGYAGMEVENKDPICKMTFPLNPPQNGIYQTKSGLCHDEFTTYKNGKKHGLFESRYSEGLLFSTGYYINNRMHGLWRSYYKSGIVSGVTIYKNGIAMHSTGFYKSGKISSYSTSTSSISMKTYQTYYDNKDNTLKRIYVPKDDDGKKHGLFKEYAPNGKLRCTIEFVHGKVVNKTVYSGKLCGEM